MTADRAPFLSPPVLLATWFGAGLAPVAPGTFGSAAALPLALLLVWLFGWPALLVAAAVIFVIGLWATGRYMALTGRQDPKEVVIDEVSAQMLPLIVAPLELLPWLAGFLLFRFFDVVKPWPCGYLDRTFHGGFGVMVDDFAAGLYALAVMILLGELGAWQ